MNNLLTTTNCRALAEGSIAVVSPITRCANDSPGLPWRLSDCAHGMGYYYCPWILTVRAHLPES